MIDKNMSDHGFLNIEVNKQNKLSPLLKKVKEFLLDVIF